MRSFSMLGVRLLGQEKRGIPLRANLEIWRFGNLGI